MSTHKKLYYRANLQNVVKIISSLRLNQRQITELKRTPFWLLIEVILNNIVEYDKCKRHDEVITKIVSYFEKPYLKIVFENYEMKIDEMDVRLIFGIKDGGNKLELSYENFYVTPFLERCFPEKIRNQYHRLDIDLIREALVEASGKSTNTGAQDVARLVTLYILGTLLIPSTSSIVPWALTSILNDMNAICEYNWCGLVMDRLIKSFNKRMVANHPGCVVMLPYWLCEHTKIVEPVDTQCFPRFLKWDVEQFGKVFMRTDLKNLNSDDIVQGSLKPSEKEKTLLGDKNAQRPLKEQVQQQNKELERVLLDRQTSERDVGTSGSDFHHRGKRALDTLYNVVPPAKKPHTSCTIGVKDVLIPEWAQVLESVSELIDANPGDWIQRCVKESLEKKPPEWAKTILESLISKGAYNERDLRPTKEAIFSILRIVRCGVLSWMTENSNVETTFWPFNHHHGWSIPEDNDLATSAGMLDSTYSSEDEIPLQLPFSNLKNDIALNSCKARRAIVLRDEFDLTKSRGDQREAFKTLGTGRVGLEFQMFNSKQNLEIFQTKILESEVQTISMEPERALNEKPSEIQCDSDWLLKTLNEDLPVEKDTTNLTDEAKRSSAALHSISKILKSAIMAQKSFENLEKDNEKLASELALMKSRVQELKQDLNRSEFKSLIAQEKVKAIKEDLAFSNSRVQVLGQNLVSNRILANSQIQELESDRALANSRIQELEKELEDERTKSHRTQIVSRIR